MEIALFSRRKKAAEFERLAAGQENRIYRICFHMMGNRQDAEDCAQEAMVRAFRAFDSFRREADFSTWLIRIAMNACTDELRRRKKTMSLDTLREEKGFDVVDGAPGAYARLEEKERKRLLREALEQLPEEMRRMIVLRDMEKMSYEEIAQALETPLGTVKSRISRAREKLCDLLKKAPETSELFSSTSV